MVWNTLFQMVRDTALSPVEYFSYVKKGLSTEYTFDQDGNFKVSVRLYPEFKHRQDFLNEELVFIRRFSEKTGNKFFPLPVAGIDAPHKINIITYITVENKHRIMER